MMRQKVLEAHENHKKGSPSEDRNAGCLHDGVIENGRAPRNPLTLCSVGYRYLYMYIQVWVSDSERCVSE